MNFLKNCVVVNGETGISSSNFIKKKYLLLCFEDERKVLWTWNDMKVSN